MTYLPCCQILRIGKCAIDHKLWLVFCKNANMCKMLSKHQNVFFINNHLRVITFIKWFRQKIFWVKLNSFRWVCVLEYMVLELIYLPRITLYFEKTHCIQIILQLIKLYKLVALYYFMNRLSLNNEEIYRKTVRKGLCMS